MEIGPVGAELFHAEGQTDITKLIVTFSSSENAPNKVLNLQYFHLPPVFANIRHIPPSLINQT